MGFALMVRADPHASYWTRLLPATAVIASGMAEAIATLDDRHTGTASGFNSAVVRAGGLIATALAGGVIAASAAQLTGAFHMAAIVAAMMAVCAGLLGYSMLNSH